jgi:hypothetical protein
MTARPPRTVAASVVSPVSSSRSVSTTADPVGAQPQLVGGDLAKRRVDPLAHLGPRVIERHVPVGLGPEDGAAEFRDAVADARVLGAAGDPDVASAAIRVAHGEQGPFEPDARSQSLAGREPVALLERVAPADLPAVEAHLLRQPIEAAFDRERRLRNAEPAHRAARRVVGVDGPRLDVEGGHAIRAAGMAGRALEDLCADARVRARVADDPGADGDQSTLAVAAHRIGQRTGALRGSRGSPRDSDEDRPAGQPGEQRRVALDAGSPRRTRRRWNLRTRTSCSGMSRIEDPAAVLPDAWPARRRERSPAGAAGQADVAGQAGQPGSRKAARSAGS